MNLVGHWKVTAAKDAGPKPNPHGGTLYRWYLTLEPKDGGDALTEVYWQRKAEDKISVGDEFHGEVSEGQYGPRFKLTSPDGPGPRGNTGGGGAAAGGSSTPGGTNRGAGEGPDEAYWAERSARIERQHAQEMALRWFDIPEGQRPAIDGWSNDPDPLKRVIDWHERDVIENNAFSQNTPPAEGEGAASESGPERQSETDPPPNPPVSPQQKGKVTQLLNAKIAKDHHDQLRAAFGADRVLGARKLWQSLDALDASGVDQFLLNYGITPKSDVPWDDDPGEDPGDEALAEMGLTPTDED